MKVAFAKLAAALASNEAQIVEELREVQGRAVDLGGYYFVDKAKTGAVMRPSELFNELLASPSADPGL